MNAAETTFLGPRIIGRNGRGMGSWVWIAPAKSGQSPEDLDAMYLSMTEHWHKSMADEFGEITDGSDAFGLTLSEPADAGDRSSSSDLFYEHNDNVESDEFADDDIFERGATRQLLQVEAGDTVLEIRVLGPIEINGWVVPPQRKVLIELACFLGLHNERPMSGDEVRAALWSDADAASEASAKSLRTYVSELRRSLPPGILPPARQSRYAFASGATTDWDAFQALVRAAEESSADAISSLRAALALVRGRPFADVDYRWVYGEFLVSEMEVAIGAAARRLAVLATDEGDYATASFALRRGLLASPFDFALWEEALRAAAGVSADELARTWRDARATLGADAKSLAGVVEGSETFPNPG